MCVIKAIKVQTGPDLTHFNLILRLRVEFGGFLQRLMEKITAVRVYDMLV